ncbi:hypothetical protein [Caballeronia sp. LZ016]|uniref:hypothetical protein n=1 Tax=Caballeronia sp. LZ016 TaxID=3038554 RepID=UPI002858E82C|nr:hypothetical protein [Caballeronia sp. LZ016]MDR5739501.1 hypothetical protein [Caballeronia sp. LZ016]
MIGTITCLCCGEKIPAKQNELGTLDVSCNWCDMPVYAKPGSAAHKQLMARVQRFAEPAPDATNPVHPPPVEAKPAARAVRGVFDVFTGA